MLNLGQVTNSVYRAWVADSGRFSGLDLDNAAAAFQATERPRRQAEEKQKRIMFLEKKVQTKEEVVAQSMAAHRVKKRSRSAGANALRGVRQIRRVLSCPDCRARRVSANSRRGSSPCYPKPLFERYYVGYWRHAVEACFALIGDGDIQAGCSRGSSDRYVVSGVVPELR